MVLDKADQQLIDSLRAKYQVLNPIDDRPKSGSVSYGVVSLIPPSLLVQNDGPVDTTEQQDSGANKGAAAPWPAAAAPDSLAHVHVCCICQGSGVNTEVYEYRHLQSSCKHCHGEGVLVTGSKSSDSQHDQCRSNDISISHGHVGPLKAEVEANNRKRAQQRATKLQQKIDEITQEKANMIAAFTAEPDGRSNSTRRALQENVVEQLQVYLDSLKTAHSAAKQALGFHDTASEA